MSSRLSVFFYAILCLEIGVVLTVLPWVPHGWLGLGLGDWGNNYFLWLAAHKTTYGLQRVVASGWIRGAVSGIGLLNIGMGVWELINFRKTVAAMEAEEAEPQPRPPATTNEGSAVKADLLSDYPRRNR
jgi:hypothetical protein